MLDICACQGQNNGFVVLIRVVVILCQICVVIPVPQQ